MSEDAPVEITEWSKKHTRIKFEMVISSVLAFFVTSGDLKEYKLPFMTVENLHFEDNVIRSVALLASLFFFFCFIVRTRFEANRFNDYKFLEFEEIRSFTAVIKAMKVPLKNMMAAKSELTPKFVVRGGAAGKKDPYWDLGEVTPHALSQLKIIKESWVSFSELEGRVQSNLSDMTIDLKHFSPIGLKFWHRVQFSLSAMQNVLRPYKYVQDKYNITEDSKGIRIYSTLVPPDFWTSDEMQTQKYDEVLKSSVVLSKKLHFQSTLFYIQRWVLSVFIPVFVSTGLVSLAVFAWVQK